MQIASGLKIDVWLRQEMELQNLGSENSQFLMMAVFSTMGLYCNASTVVGTSLFYLYISSQVLIGDNCCVCVVISKESEHHHNIGSLMDGAHPSPKTDRDHLDKLGHYCLKSFEMAKGKKERWCRQELNPESLA